MNPSEEKEILLLKETDPNDYESMQMETNEVTAQDPNEYTFEEAIEHFGFGRFQIRVCVCAGLIILSDAAQILAPVVLSSVLECESWKLSKISVAWLTTVVFLGMIVFSPALGWIIDKFGRKKGILLTLIGGAVIAALGSFSPSYPYLIVSRFLVGAALAVNFQVYVYLEEFLPIGHRRTAMLTQFFWPLGGLWVSGFGLLMLYKYNLSWKWYLLVLSAPLFLTVPPFILLPESGRFLEALGQFERVEKILKNIGDENKTGLPKGKLSRTSLCGLCDNESESSKAKFKDLFSGRNLKTTLLLSFIWFASGFSYYGVVFLVPILNTKKGVDTPNCVPLKLSDYSNLMWTGFAELPGTFLAFCSLEYIGRKKTLIGQFIITGLSLIPFFFDVLESASFTAILIARAVCQGIISSLVIYTPEVYPTFLRGKGIGVANMFFRTGGMLTPFFSQVTVEHYFNVTIGIYMGCCFVAAICALVLPKETQGRQLED